LILQAQPFDCQALGPERQTERDFHNGQICSTRDQPRGVVYLNVDMIFSMERHGNYTHLKPENRPNDSFNVMETPDDIVTLIREEKRTQYRPIVNVEHHLPRLSRIRPCEQHAAVAGPDVSDLYDQRSASWLQAGQAPSSDIRRIN
jgi:hypothetical protein